MTVRSEKKMTKKRRTKRKMGALPETEHLACLKRSSAENECNQPHSDADQDTAYRMVKAVRVPSFN